MSRRHTSALTLALALVLGCGGDDMDDDGMGDDGMGDDAAMTEYVPTPLDLACRDVAGCVYSDCSDEWFDFGDCRDDDDRTECDDESDALAACSAQCDSGCSGEGCEAAASVGVCVAKDCAGSMRECQSQTERCAGALADTPIESC